MERFVSGETAAPKLDSAPETGPPTKWNELLRPHKTVRDPVHRDIWLTHLEVRVVDTEAFQRLRSHKQLGPCALVYPGAEHSRFQHSLGTMYVANRIASAINNNPKPVDPNDPRPVHARERVLVRLCALLHDVVNIPFGHTFEEEGNLLARDWKDDRRVNQIIGDSSTIGSAIINEIDQHMGNGGAKLLHELKDVLTAGNETEIEKLPHPYVADIVSNTICADLLDYLKRDRHYTGIQEAYDDRIMNYFVLADYKGHKRMAIRLWTDKHRMKRDILSELVDLLRLRYSLAEKVYFHHTKMAASAMLIRAIDDGGLLGSRFETLLNIGDDQLLGLIEESQETSREIMKRYRSRDLYKPVYQISYAKRGAGANLADKIWQVANDFHKPAKRKELEAKLEAMESLRALGITRGHVIVYCPDPKMNMKVATTKVIWQDGKVYNIIDVPDEELHEEVESIEEKHRKLWRMLILLHPVSFKAAESNGSLGYIGSLCEREIGIPNDLPFRLSPLAQRVLEQDGVVDRLRTYEKIAQYAEKNPTQGVSEQEVVELTNSLSARAERGSKYVPITDDQIQTELRELRRTDRN